MLTTSVASTAKKTDYGLYDLRDITARIKREREKRDVPVKVIAEVIWPHLGPNARFDWYKAVNFNGSYFTLDEIGRIARYFKAPKPWPFVEMEIAEAFQRWLDGGSRK